MLILYDFRCEGCRQVHEALSDNKNPQAGCPTCDGPMIRLISPVRSALDPHAGFPDAEAKWTKRHEVEGRKPSESHPDGW